MADKIIKFGVQKIAGGIGLASEAITAHKEKKHAGSPAPGPNSNNNASKPHTPPPLDQMRSYSDPPLHKISDPSILQEDEEEQWALDDVQESLVPRENPPPYPEDNQQDNSPPPNKVPQLIAAFILHHPAPSHLPPQLQFPVLLPQRRPKDKTRGFIRAYAPLLMDSGIDQTTFFEFLDLFDRASAASPWLNAINLAGLAFSFLPTGISMAISVAIGIAVKAAMEMQSRARTNTFLDKINHEFFRPRGLYCLIMTWNPEASSAITSVNLTSTITSNITPPTSIPQNLSHKFRGSDSNASPDMSFPATAPLIFPALEDLASSTSTESATIRENMKQKGKFVAEYWDKRARAKYAAKNPDSVLVQGPKAEFTSRYADPTHPASSGSLVSLVTGGHINPPSLRELRGGATGVGERGIGMGRGPWGGRQMGYGSGYDGYGMMDGGYGYGPAYGGRFGGGRLGGGRLGGGLGGGLGYGRMGGGFGGGFGGGLGGGRMGMGRGFGGLVGLVSGIENMAMGRGRTPLDARMQMSQEAQYEYGYGRAQMGPGYYPGRQEYEYGREPYYPQNAGYALREPDMSRGLSDTPGTQGRPGLGRGIGGGFGGLGCAGGIQNIIPIKKVLMKHVLYMMIVNMPSEEEMAVQVSNSKLLRLNRLVRKDRVHI